MRLENLNFLHYYQPQPIIYKLGLISFYWYGLFVILGVLAGIFAWRYYAKKTGSFVGKDCFLDIIIGCAFWGFIGARVYHIFCELPYYWQNPLEILLIWHGGLSIFGALIAGAIFIVFFARKKHLNLFVLLDGYALAILIGEAIGRWGNYFNQEIFGLPLNRWWGIYISSENRPDIFSSFSYFHPTFLYQFIYNLIVLSAIIIFLNITKKIPAGSILSFYLIFYSIGRFLFEFLRIDYQPVIGFLRLSQWLCILMFGVGVFLFFKSKLKNQNAK